MENKVIIEAELSTKSFDKQIDDIEYQLKQLDYELSHAKELNLDDKTIKEYELQAEKLTNTLADLKKKQSDLNKSDLSQIGKSMENIVKKVSKWALAVIGIRSIYLGIRKAISTLAQDNQELANKLNYIQFAIATSIQPLIEWIIEAIYQILGLVGRLVYLISGKNIFANSGVKDFQKSMSNSAKSAKDIKKTLSGFDEANVLEDNTKTSGGASGGLGNLPDLSKMVTQGTAVEKIIQNLVDKWLTLGEEMKNTLSNPEMFTEAYGVWGTFIEGITRSFYGLWEVIQGGIEIVGSVMDIIVGIFTGDFDLIKSGFTTLLYGIGDLLSGFVNIIVGIIQTILGIVKGLLGEIWNAVVNVFSSIWNTLVDGAKWAWDGIKSVFSTVASFFKNIFTNAWQGVVKVFSVGGKIFNGIKDGILNAFKKVVNVIIDGINKVVAIPFNGINSALQKIKGVDLWGWKPFDWIQTIKVPQIPRLARGGIVNNPGKGVMMGNYVAGERGAEAVIPLTDSQQMALLGETIGKYITVNASIINTMNGRIISKELQKVQSDSDFAFNR